MDEDFVPKWLLDALVKTNERYDSGDSDFTATSLISPPMIVRLRKENDVEIDPITYLSSFTGTSIHNQIETALKDNPDYIIEKRFYTEVDGYKISGQIDLYEKSTKTLYDHKCTSIYKITGDDHLDYEAQLNINAYILQCNGIEVENLVISSFPQDWRNSEKKKEGYPQIRFKALPMQLWKLEQTVDFIRERIALHTQEKVDICSARDRWKTEDKYAVLRNGRRTALKLHDTELDAYKHVAQLGGSPHFVQKREGYNRRCMEYCVVNKFCSFYNELVKEDDIEIF